MTYDPRQTFSAQQSAYGRASGVTSSKTNANKQAAKTMKAAGIGGLGGRPTTSAAQRIQDKFRRETQRDDDRSKPATPQKNFLGNLLDRVKSSIRFAGGDPERKRRPDPNPSALYTASPFIIPAATAVTASVLGPAVDYTDPTQVPTEMPRIYTPASRDFGKGAEPMAAPEKPESAKFDVTDLLGLKEKVARGDTPGLMASPSMAKPAAPATARSAAMTAGINKILKDVIAPESKEYKIKGGDTLSAISRREGVSVEDLVEINGIEDKDKIYAGDSIIIPKPEEVEQAKEFVLRVSTRGDEDPDAQFYQSFRQGIMTPKEFDQKLVDRIVELEGFIPEAKMAFKTDRHPTIGYGQSDSNVKLGQKTTQKQAEKNLKEKLIPEKIKTAKRLFPNFDEFSDPLKIEIVQGVFRGDFKKEHKTVKLINQNKWEEASEEFLNHKEYEKAKKEGKNSDRRGIVDRLEDISKAINKEQFK